MILIVDKNEKDVNPKVYQSLVKHFSKVLVANLPHHEYGGITVTAGDINIPLDDGSLLAIERKTATDFLGSIPNRHIFNQVEVMASHAKYSAIIVTGKLSYTHKSDMVCADEIVTEWNGKSVRAVINAIQFSGCPVVFCPADEYCNMIVEIYNLVNKDDKHQGVIKNRIITFPPVDARVENIAQLPGVGMTMADSALRWVKMMDEDISEDEYGTIASFYHWLSIMVQIDKGSRPAGWGAKKILTVRKFLGLKSNEYIAINKEIDNANEETSEQE